MSNRPYKPDRRLIDAYTEATELDENGLKGLCPSYIELSEADTRYQDYELLGRGAVKDVYKTFNNHTKRWIAMARLRADRGEEFYDLFVHEAWLTASLSHPNIITVHDAGIDHNGRPFFTMDLKGKSNLADRVAGGHTAGRQELLEIFMKVCDAVAYAHSRGVIHLDLKPDNIQTEEFGEVLVCDWGLAKLVGEMEEGEGDLPEAFRPIENMTLVGQIKGSLGFMAPEQVVPGAVKDQQSDIYALGCILHLLLTGHAPFEGSEKEVMELTRKGEVVPPRQRYPESHIPAALEAVVLKATDPSPQNRYQAVVVLRDEISKFLGGYSTLAEKSGFFREAGLFIARNRLPVTITLFAIVSISVLSVLSIQRIRKQEQRVEAFETKAETAQNLYQDELERSETERKNLAASLATSASDLKKLGIFVRPVQTVREAHKLVASAFALDPDCSTAHLQRFSLSCITMDFKQALEAPVRPQSSLADYLQFLEDFSSYDFTEDKRPEVGQLRAFLLRARDINPNREALMERIVAYDYSARTDKENYTPAVAALIKYVNVPNDLVTLDYNSDESTLYIRAKAYMRFAIWDEWASNECLLRFLAFRTLKVDTTGRFFPGDLQGLSIETLDLSGCNELVFNHSVNLPLLREIIIRPGQITPDQLHELIRSNEQFEIIEQD